MSMYLRWICLAVILIIAGLVTLELVSIKSGKTSTGKPLIRVACASWQKGDMPIEDFIAAYQHAHPEVQLELKVMPPASANKLSLLWRNGETPYDVLIAFADEEIHNFIRQGLLMDVQTFLSKEQIDAFIPASLAGSTVQGHHSQHLYMVPLSVEIMVLNARHDLLQQRGLAKPPQDWKAFEEIALKMKSIEVDGRTVWPITSDLSQGFMFGQNVYIPLLASFTNGKISDNRGRLIVSGPEAQRVFMTVKQWYLAGLISPSAKLSGQADKDFTAGLGVFFPHWQSRGGYAMKEMPPSSISIWPVPGAKEYGSLVSCYGAIVPKASPVKRQAIEFAYDCFGQWIQPSIVASAKLPTTKNIYQNGFNRKPEWLEQLRRDHQKEEWFQRIDKIYSEAELPDWMKELYPALVKGYSFPDHPMWPKINHEISIAFQKFLNSDAATPDLRELQEIVDELYTKRETKKNQSH
jgi:ABC-type glycerol-3-phosphate transport system substrate-binding protein